MFEVTYWKPILGFEFTQEVIHVDKKHKLDKLVENLSLQTGCVRNVTIKMKPKKVK